MTYYANDPDVHVDYPITDSAGNDLTFTPTVRLYGLGGPPDVTGTWLGDVGSTRDLRVPLTGLRSGATYRLRLVVPGDNDLTLGSITLT